MRTGILQRLGNKTEKKVPYLGGQARGVEGKTYSTLLFIKSVVEGIHESHSQTLFMYLLWHGGALLLMEGNKWK